jgi:4-hydroxy-tetrahydrodipicolinate synthase
MTQFELHAALTTPFRDDGQVDHDALRAHVELLVDDGLDGVAPAGTTGEGPLLEESEVAAVVATTVQAAAGRCEVIGHIGRASTPATLRLARAAAGAGVDAVMAVTPYYFSHGDDALVAHYRALLAAVKGTPVLAYAFPDRTGNQLSPEALDLLAGDGLVGLKDSTKSPERLAEYLEVARRHDGFRVFVGSERLTLRALEGGGAGTISALANARADVLLRMRDEVSEDAQSAVNGAREELPAIPEVKRAVRERLAERGVDYPAAPRAPLGSAAQVPLRG